MLKGARTMPLTKAVDSSTSTERVEVLASDSSAYTYDLNGNMTLYGELSFTWDQKNRLVRVTGTPEGTVDYTYDALDRRVSKVVNGVTTQYLYDGLNIVAETDEYDTVVAWYVMGLSVDEPLVRIDASGNELTYHADVLGSIVALTNSSGAVTTQYNYSPFGVTEVIGTDISQPFRFTGREWDAETGMYYYRARYYAPELKRFISEDPIRFESGDENWYRYVGNDPVNFTDSLGLFGGIFPGYCQEWHHEQRQRLQDGKCPDTKPDEESICLDEAGWYYEGKSIVHCGLDTYRGTGSNSGYQCVYDKYGKLETDPECAGSFDYSPPSEGLFDHFIDDFFPWALCGN